MVSRAAAIEPDRLRLLSARDGAEPAMAWVRRTLDLYRAARRDPRSPCSWPPYDARVDEVIAVQEAWLAAQRAPPLGSPATPEPTEEAMRHLTSGHDLEDRAVLTHGGTVIGRVEDVLCDPDGALLTHAVVRLRRRHGLPHRCAVPWSRLHPAFGLAAVVVDDELSAFASARLVDGDPPLDEIVALAAPAGRHRFVRARRRRDVSARSPRR